MHVFRSGGSAFGYESGHGFAGVDLGYASDREGPEYLLADHDQYFALVHLARVGDERKGNLESAEGFDVKFGLGIVEEAKNLFVSRLAINHLDADCDIVFERVAELD